MQVTSISQNSKESSHPNWSGLFSSFKKPRCRSESPPLDTERFSIKPGNSFLPGLDKNIKTLSRLVSILCPSPPFFFFWFYSWKLTHRLKNGTEWANWGLATTSHSWNSTCLVSFFNSLKRPISSSYFLWTGNKILFEAALKPTMLAKIVLRNCGLTDLPYFCGQCFPVLRVLDLSTNRLSSADFLRSFENLKVHYLSLILPTCCSRLFFIFFSRGCFWLEICLGIYRN